MKIKINPDKKAEKWHAGDVISDGQYRHTAMIIQNANGNNLQLKNGGRKLRTKFFTSVIDVDKSIDQKINELIETSNPSMRIIDIKFQTNYSATLLKASALIIYEDDGSSEGYASDEEYKERLENFLRELESKEDAD